ncbi:MAG TPA: HTTM domain-containing protein [Polyangiaceae bacterium]|nr:HTTM domain-containing protein [Polyangiaceae bacterium]
MSAEGPASAPAGGGGSAAVGGAASAGDKASAGGSAATPAGGGGRGTARRGVFGGARRAARAWVSFWDRREHPASLALVRIFVAATIAADYAQVAALGLVGVLWAPAAEGGLSAARPGAPLCQAFAWFGPSAATARAVFGVALASALCLGVGLFSRASALVLLLASAQLGHILPDGDRGIDTLLRNALVVLCLSPAGETWSVDARRRRGAWSAPAGLLAPAWPRYLLVAQLVVLYFSAGAQKLSSPWSAAGGYSALYYLLNHPHYATFDFRWTGRVYPLTQFGTFMTLLFEQSAPLVPLALYYRATRERPGRLRRLFNRSRFFAAWVFTGAAFHLLLAVTMNLGIFPWGVLALYPALFAPREIMAFLSRARRPLGPRARADAGGPAGPAASTPLT